MSLSYEGIKTTLITGFKLNVFWTAMHWCSVQLYQKFCIPSTFSGYIFTPIMTQAPHCKLLIWCHTTSVDAFNSLRSVFVSFMVAVIHTYFSVDDKIKIK